MLLAIQTWYEALVERPEDSQSRYRLSIIIISGVKSKEDHFQGRSQELEMGGAKLLGEGSGGRLRPQVGPGQSPDRGARGAKPPGSYRVLNI